jgi:phosphopantothenoylcysteine decarboxylase/phosphopantothenate--cysteine ligase
VLTGKRILLIIGGGIAAYKALELIRLLRKGGAAVRTILTRAGSEFVTPLSLGSLTEDKVYQDLFSLTDEAEMGHIQLSRDADLLVVVPATADLMGRMAGGLANDLASAALLATDKPVLIAPAMNVRMWHHPATQRNLARLKADGILTVGPGEGEMACGEFGLGRMAEPAEILAAIETALSPGRPLAGKRALITAGPTAEPIDPVRVLTNRSSGKQGYAIAGALAKLGAETLLVSGPTALAAPDGVTRVDVETAEEMLAACEAGLPADVAVFSAAVADWRVENRANEKIKKGKNGNAPMLRLIANPDILKTIATRIAGRPRLVVGFAAETENLLAHAAAKRLAKGCDWLIANDVSPENGIFGGDANTVHFLTGSSTESWPAMSKEAVAAEIAARVAAYFAA